MGIRTFNGGVTIMASQIGGQVSANQIMDGAVESKHIKDQAVITNKIADGAVIGSSKIATQSITTTQLSDGAKTIQLGALAVEDTVIGIAENLLKWMEFAVRNDVAQPDKIKLVLEVKSSAATDTATFKVYFDSNPTAAATITSVSETYELQTVSVTVGSGPQALAQGKHTLYLKGSSSAATGIAYNKLLTIW